MRERQQVTIIQRTALISFLIMVGVNVLANILPINGITTGEVSDSFPNLFAPAALTFSIWGLIYLLLAAYTLYLLGFFRGDTLSIYSTGRDLLIKTGFFFTVSSLANAAWVFSWHFIRIPLSMVFMVVILICLIIIMEVIRGQRLSSRENLFIRFPFSIYFGWITVATIANFKVLLVSLGWNRFGLSEVTWTVIMIIMGLLIGVGFALRNSDVPYLVVLIWAYSGILLKHISGNGFGGQYPAVIYTVTGCIAVLFGVIVYIFVNGKKSRRIW